jgi:cobalt-zinc-cadmium efflux system protein
VTEGPYPGSQAPRGQDQGPNGEADARTVGTNVRYLTAALALISAFIVGEVVAAVVSGSLALFSDAGHMLTDVAALGASVWAARLSARPAGGIWTYGLKRAEIISAAGNGLRAHREFE